MTDSEFVNSIESHRHEFYRYVLRNVWNPEVANDVFSSAILAAYKQLSKFKDGTNFRAWLYKILTNKCFVANRETQRMAVHIDTIDEQNLGIHSHEQRLDFENPGQFLEMCGDEVNLALEQLSTAQRSCLLLFAFGQFRYKEIAEILDIPIGTVMTHLARGRKKLKHSLTPYAIKEGILSKEKIAVTRVKEMVS